MKIAVERKYNSPYAPKEKLKALELLKTSSLNYVARRYHCHPNTIYLWRKQFDGSIASLENKSHRPLTQHPNSQTPEEIKHIDDLVKRNPNIGLNELYGKLRQNYAYTRNPTTLYKYLKKKGFYESKKHTYKKYVAKKYDTPVLLGEKWQLDVKYVPKDCICSNIISDERFYQYTVIDECSRERFIYAYREINGNTTVDFIKRAIIYFGYLPKIIQTDNGPEFTYWKQIKNNKVHLFDKFCMNNKIEHHTIKPRTPRHNGKVERSHRNDNERFYRYLKFYSFDDLQNQMRDYLKRSNNTPSSALGWKSPKELRKYHLLYDWGIIE